MASLCSILARKTLMTEEPWWTAVHGATEGAGCDLINSDAETRLILRWGSQPVGLAKARQRWEGLASVACRRAGCEQGLLRLFPGPDAGRTSLPAAAQPGLDDGAAAEAGVGTGPAPGPGCAAALGSCGCPLLAPSPSLSLPRVLLR